ncbi:B3 domain-containing protein Os12g0592300-like isoform X2 [Macadamia integrifolia]|uniref:B3 domain-containing protein Os12g0592300-like isoform X2 n=1 Tax=Macadamia integrifolia TaxID=60698 RepID=UPI001C4EAB74|nr:B3 domain-containing protein Os12g0592300-like isoform X2 [Macadamia integrifolia]
MEHTCRECKKWQEHWYWNHLEPTQIRFSRIITATFINQGLVVPIKIVSKFTEQLVNTTILKNLSGKTWTIGLEERHGELVFQQGWAAFVSYYSLKQGDIMTFQYGGDSTFTVSMFDGESGYEKVGLPVPNLQGRETNVHVEYSREGSLLDDSSSDESSQPSSPMNNNNTRVTVESEQSDDGKSGHGKAKAETQTQTESESEDYNLPRKKARNAESSSRMHRRSTRLSTSRKGKSVCKDMNSRDTGRRVINLDKTYPTHFLSGRRPVSRAEIEKTYQLASAFPSNKPSFTVSMLPTHVSRRFFLTIRKEFLKKHIPESTKEVVLRVPPGMKKWVITYDGNDRGYGNGLSGGWMNFVWDNNLEVGDACVFQITQLPPGNEYLKTTIAMDVKMFRVVKKITKLTKLSRNLLLKGECST